MATLSFKNIEKIYDDKVVAVKDFNLEIADKEFIVFVGPSGCGKSTTLRMVAGLEEISAGELYIDEELINDVAPKNRNIAMVFQSYALYPHMTVYDNMAFSLKLKKVPKKEIKEKVEEAARILDLTPYLDRKPKALSGGQRQRVALGRAIVRNPKVFLMDEPLSNLDAKLRVQMRTEILRIHKQVGATTIYVTHDQTEAMTMADRIVVMSNGLIQQIGTPKEIYNHPENLFVAGFMGSPSMNFFPAQTNKGKLNFSISEKENISIGLLTEQKNLLKNYEGKTITFGIRPDDIHLEGDLNNKKPSEPLSIVVEISELLGHERILYGNVGSLRVIAKVDATNEIASGDKIKICFDLSKAHFFDADTTNRIK